MKVLFVESVYPHLSESYVATEIEYFLGKGVRVEVWSHAEKVVAPYAPPQVPVHYGSFVEACAKAQPDLITAHFAQDLELPFVRDYCLKHRISAVLRGHSVDHSKERFSQLLDQDYVRRIYLFPHFYERDFKNHSKVIPVPACYRPRLHYPESKDRRLVLRAGAGLPYKDIETFFKVASVTPEFKFACVVSRSSFRVDYPDILNELNNELGRPVELFVNLSHEETAALSRQAGIFLHTFKPSGHPFGMPVGAVEAMASGSYLLLRNVELARKTFGDSADYYDTAEEASELIRSTLNWTDDRWEGARKKATNFSESLKCDQVLGIIYHDWLEITGKER